MECCNLLYRGVLILGEHVSVRGGKREVRTKANELSGTLVIILLLLSIF